MKILSAAAFTLTLLASSLPISSPVEAGSGIQRCESADGTTVYTDSACSLLGAVSRPLPGELMTRIAREQARTAPSPDDSTPVASPTIAVRRSPTAGCARTATQLSMDLRGSLALGDVNRVAESYHWVGLSQKQSGPIIRRLERLANLPLEDAQYFSAEIGPGGMQLADADGGNTASGVMQLRFGGHAAQAVDFEVTRYAGCYFIKF